MSDFLPDLSRDYLAWTREDEDEDERKRRELGLAVDRYGDPISYPEPQPPLEDPTEEQPQPTETALDRLRRFEAQAAGMYGMTGTIRYGATLPTADAMTQAAGGDIIVSLDEDPATFRERAMSTAAGGLRLLANVLSPLQLPQDVFFATLEAALDDDKTLLENLKAIEWAEYFPGGEIPERVTDGGTILGLMGVEDEQAKKWGGLAMDLVVDPLIFGSVLRVTGRLGKIDDLVRIGTNVDNAMAPAQWARSAYRRIPAVRNSFDRITEGVLRTIQNPDASVLGMRSGMVNTLMNWGMPSRTASRLRLAEGSPEMRLMSELGEPQDLAARLHRAEQLGAQRAEDAVAAVGQEMHQIGRLIGNQEMGDDVVRRVLKSLGLMRRIEVDELGNIPQIVSDAALAEIYEFAATHPAALVRGVGLTDDVEDMLGTARWKPRWRSRSRRRTR